ncbi:MAG: polyphenol oxidase family protein [Thermoleophilia bacterium]
MRSVNNRETDPGGGGFHREERGRLTLWQFDQAPAGINVFFTTRMGGVSGAPHDSLNLGFHVGDSPDSVMENRRLLSGILGLDPAKLTSPRQRHTAEVANLEQSSQVGGGSISEESPFDPCDGLLTGLFTAPILLHFADCLPVVLAAASPDGPVVAVLHAGRQGLMRGILKNGAQMMIDHYQVEAGSISAAIGPHIGSCCYKVSGMIAAGFAERFGTQAVNGVFLDLAQASTADLVAMGLEDRNIHHLEICTCCDSEFYSYRRDGVTGRHGAIAWIE